MAKNMIAKFEKYWESMHVIMAVATILDPRYKFKIIDYFFEEFYGEIAAEEIIRVKKTVMNCCMSMKVPIILAKSPNIHLMLQMRMGMKDIAFSRDLSPI